MIEKITNCRKCNLCKNQLPLLDKKEYCDVMWVGLSAKKVKDVKINYPLEDDTNSGKIIKEIEELLPNINFYKTNLVKCLPLSNVSQLRYPNNDEMNMCMENLIMEIDVLKPKIVFLLGNKVYDFVIKYFKNNEIKTNCIFLKIEHPSYIYVYKRCEKLNYINKIIKEIKKII